MATRNGSGHPSAPQHPTAGRQQRGGSPSTQYPKFFELNAEVDLMPMIEACCKGAPARLAGAEASDE